MTELWGTMEVCEPTRLVDELRERRTRDEIWDALLYAASRCGAREAQIVQRTGEQLRTVAATGAPWREDSGVRDPDIVGWVLEHGQVRSVPDGSAHGDGATVLVPISERGETVAVLRAQRDEPWSPTEIAAFKMLGFAVSARLTERAWALASQLVSELASRLAHADDLTTAAAAALGVIAPALDARGAALLEARADKLVLLASHGDEALRTIPCPADGVPFGQGVAWQVAGSGEHWFGRAEAVDPDALMGLPAGPVLLLKPLERRGAARCILALSFDERSAPTEADLAILRNVADVLALQMQGLREDRAQEGLLSLLRPLASCAIEDVYPRALAVAIDSVPGAQVGSILVREPREPTFHYRAARGYDLDALRTVAMPESVVRGWYDPVVASWGDARPRVATASSGHLDVASPFGDGDGPFERAAGLDAIRANLCIPITVDGEVRAIVNLDSRLRDDAFGADSLRIARQGAVVGTSLLRLGMGFGTLHRAASTDLLTGLPNRRAAEKELSRALARARREDDPLSVLVMDMANFKAINDEHGHRAGDEALERVAAALRDNVREGDTVARWGGDEFVAILPRLSGRTVRHAVRRLTDAVSGLHDVPEPLEIHIGTASFPTDAIVADDLIAIADERMYDAKRAARDAERATHGVD